MLAIREDGQVVGSVSGGCIEDDLIANARANGLNRVKPGRVTYGISADEAHRFGLPCGGTLELALEPLTNNSRLTELLARMQRGELVSRQLDLHTGAVTLGVAQPGQGLSISDAVLLTVHGPSWRLLLIGAGQLSVLVAQMAQALNYAVTVCDPREEYRQSWTVPGIELRTGMPDDVVLAMKPDARSAVLALTHDPKLDDLALMEALKSQAFYVGAIGSRLNNQRRRERLARHFDLKAEQLARLHGPVGIYIGSKTPAEIAVSVLAELTAVKNGVQLPEQAGVAAFKNRSALPATGIASKLPGTAQPPFVREIAR
jgi:xanthine dehydrogenase accessory factor